MFSLPPIEILKHPPTQSVAFYKKIVGITQCDHTTADRSRFDTYMHALFRTIEDVYYQRLEGHLDPRRWRGLEAVVRELNARPGVQAWWRSHSHWFGEEEFAKFINQLQQTTKPSEEIRHKIITTRVAVAEFEKSAALCYRRRPKGSTSEIRSTPRLSLRGRTS